MGTEQKGRNGDMKLEKTEFHIGMRNLKTALAILVCLLIYQVIPGSASYACITALIVMQSTLEESIQQARNRVLGIVIGGIVGAVFSYFVGMIGFSILQILVISVGVTLLILLCNLIGKRGAIVMGCVTYLVIMLPEVHQNPWLYSLLCVIHNMIGITVAVLVNLAIRPPKKQEPQPQIETDVQPEHESSPNDTVEMGETDAENTGSERRS